MFGILAVLGRGIQRLEESDPVDETMSYALTDDLELCDKDSGHLAVHVPANDDDQLCMVGGGELNLLAGMSLYDQFGATGVVCAYGDRSKYLKSIDAPSESMVMSECFKDCCPLAPLKVWTKEMSIPGPANTNRELQNIFELAVRRQEKSIAIVTIDLHMPRTLVMAQRHLAKPEFEHLQVQFFVSEQVLVEANPRLFGPRREALRRSKSFARNWDREQIGIMKILTNAYGDEKPAVITT